MSSRRFKKWSEDIKLLKLKEKKEKFEFKLEKLNRKKNWWQDTSKTLLMLSDVLQYLKILLIKIMMDHILKKQISKSKKELQELKNNSRKSTLESIKLSLNNYN